MERRQHRRVSGQVKILLRANSHEVEGETVDLSLGGPRIESSLDVQPGKPIVVKLLIPGDDVPIVSSKHRFNGAWIGPLVYDFSMSRSKSRTN
jgi:hypothetical protein